MKGFGGKEMKQIELLKSLEMLLHHEGGYVWDKRDPFGGLKL